MSKKTGKLTFLCSDFKVDMKDNVADVDSDGRQSLFGQVDMWAHRIRLYTKRNKVEKRKTLLHEIIHIIDNFMRSETFQPQEKDVDQIADLLYDILERNELIVKDWSHVIPNDIDEE